MFLLYLIRLSLYNAVLRTASLTFSTIYTAVGNNISLFRNRSCSERIAFSENWIYTEIEIFNFSVLYLKNNANLPCIIRINI